MPKLQPSNKPSELPYRHKNQSLSITKTHPAAMDLAALSRPPAFALNLTRLPRELVLKVIDELPLIKILQILSHKNQYLDGCVLMSMKWNQLFRSPADISSVCIYAESLCPSYYVS